MLNHARDRRALVRGFDIYAIDSDGTDLVQLTASPAEEFEPAWSRDGKIAYAGTAGGTVNRSSCMSSAKRLR